MQKTAAYLRAEIRLRAAPASLDALPVLGTVEDHAPHTPLCVRNAEEQMLPLRLLAAIEARTAAQAVNPRGAAVGGFAGAVQANMRSVAPPLDEDRETGPDADRMAEELFGGGLCATLRAGLAELKLLVPVS